MALYASGRTTGLVIDSGYNYTQIVPVYDGYALPHATQHIRYGGWHITMQLKYLLLTNSKNKNSQQFKARVNTSFYRQMKEKFAYIVHDMKDEMKKPICEQPSWMIPGYLRDIDREYSKYTGIEIEKTCQTFCGNFDEFMITKREYKLPDGNIIEMKKEKFQCTECLFDPWNNRLAVEDSLGKKVVQVVQMCDVNMRGDLYTNIVLCGGNT
eukprot:87411_1